MGALVKRGGLTQVLKVYTARHIPCDLYPKISFLIAQSGQCIQSVQRPTEMHLLKVFDMNIML